VAGKVPTTHAAISPSVNHRLHLLRINFSIATLASLFFARRHRYDGHPFGFAGIHRPPRPLPLHPVHF